MGVHSRVDSSSCSYGANGSTRLAWIRVRLRRRFEVGHLVDGMLSFSASHEAVAAVQPFCQDGRR